MSRRAVCSWHSFVVSLLVAGGLTAAVLSGAAKSNRDLAQGIEARVLALLQRDGLSGLSAEIDRQRLLVPEQVRVEFHLAQQVGASLVVLNETLPGIAEAANEVPTGTRTKVRIGGRDFAIHAPDVATLSQDWDFQISDARLHFAYALPTPQTRNARRQLLIVWGGFALAVAFGILLHLDNRRRYRVGLARINAVLDSFAAGQTTAHVDIQPEAPELRRLTDELNQILPRFDRLVTDLRALTAHLAHEMNTPLQIIRTDLRRLVASEDKATRQEVAAEIDTTIDATDARLGSVMRLFRLSAEEDVAMQDDVALGALVADVVEDLEDFLVAGDRELLLNLAVDVRVTANGQLLEVAVGNLLSNASKFAPEGAAIGVDLTRHGARFRLDVWNSDSAFPDAWEREGFERLRRGQDHGGTPGFGLGLALVDMITRWHGFTLRAGNSVLDASRGTCAVVTLEGPCSGQG